MPDREIVANLSRLNELMDHHVLSAIVARSGKNFTYLSGVSYPGTLARHLDLPDSPRPVMLVWPRFGEPTMISNHYAIPLAKRDSWITRIEAYDDYAESPIRKLAQILREMNLEEKTVGFEKCYLSAAHWQELEHLLPNIRMLDCTDMMDRVRMVKTRGEIELLKKAADILDEAYLEVFPMIDDGMTEREVHSLIVKSCIQKGAQWAHGILNSSRNTVSYGGEGDFAFKKGDIVRNDYVSYYQGYPGHQSRTAVIGNPTSEQARTYRIMRDIYRSTIDQCVVGMKASAIYEFAANKYRGIGYEGRIPIVGHSVGPWWHQQEPHVVSTCEQALEEGMVLAMEPHVGYWHLQDLVMVTNKGPKLLSDRFSTDEIFVI